MLVLWYVPHNYAEEEKVIDKSSWCAGQYQAWCAQGDDVDGQKRRLNSVPGNMKEQVRSHLITVYKLKKKAEMQRRRNG